MSRPLLFALQVYSGDIEQAVRLSKLLADIQEPLGLNKSADAMVVYRRDCPPDKRLERNLEDCFGTLHRYTTARREIGFPGGPNGMWCDLMQQLVLMEKRRGLHWEAVLTTEADAVPTSSDWAEKLLSAWRRERVKVAGHLLPNGEWPCGHINGNALFCPTIAAGSPQLVGCSATRAWDTWFAPVFEALGWTDIPEIRSIYRKNGISHEEVAKLVAEGCSWLHGVKDNSAQDWARINLVDKNC